MKKSLKKHYNKKYFEDRDYLDERIAYTIRILLEKNNFKKILDVGCGTGKIVNYLNQNRFDVIGTDSSIEAIKIARKFAVKSAKKKFIKADATKLPFKRATFDMITSISVIEHLTKKQVNIFLKEAKRILKPNGIIFIVTPNLLSPVRLYRGKRWFGYSDPTHINFYTPFSLAKDLKKVRFKKIKFNFKTAYNTPFYWDLPTPIKILFVYLLWSSPLALIRDSFWVAAQKNNS
ncbi:class I SAM-dependent methyltransferase [Candidatus Daviesbacteria bacterium]|nr:class I SAM-dependent methyltransferase [Candidatus Daviesbacteria bacterium]